ncbi:unnamed protein product [Phaeothamnion confervicola]
MAPWPPVLLYSCLAGVVGVSLASETPYSFSLSTFSPSGKISQIEYAMNAIAAGTLAVGVAYRNGVVLATPRAAAAGASPLVRSVGARKIARVHDRCVATYAGLAADSRVLLARAHRLCRQYAEKYGEDSEVPMVAVVAELAATMQKYTQSPGVRPFGVSLLVAGFDPEEELGFGDGPSGAHLEDGGSGEADGGGGYSFGDGGGDDSSAAAEGATGAAIADATGVEAGEMATAAAEMAAAAEAAAATSPATFEALADSVAAAARVGPAVTSAAVAVAAALPHAYLPSSHPEGRPRLHRVDPSGSAAPWHAAAIGRGAAAAEALLESRWTPGMSRWRAVELAAAVVADCAGLSAPLDDIDLACVEARGVIYVSGNGGSGGGNDGGSSGSGGGGGRRLA